MVKCRQIKYPQSHGSYGSQGKTHLFNTQKVTCEALRRVSSRAMATHSTKTAWEERAFFRVYGCFLKWWYPTTMGFPIKNDHIGCFGGTTIFGCFRKLWVFPPNHPLKNRVFHCKPSILGETPLFLVQHPYVRRWSNTLINTAGWNPWTRIESM